MVREGVPDDGGSDDRSRNGFKSLWVHFSIRPSSDFTPSRVSGEGMTGRTICGTTAQL
jgi:hypothetical protein